MSEITTQEPTAAKAHISYAMQNEEATQSAISFNAPGELLGWSHHMIETLVIIGFILALIHAFKTDKKDNSISARLTFLNIFLYGLTIDILSYYTVENFWHGEFSVMFLFNKLPLYIACFYPAFFYHTFMLIKRYNFTPLVSAICLGFYSSLVYLIFDNLGPMLGWWIWDTTDPTTWPYVSSVPLTSYHWLFTFTIALALVNHKVAYTWAPKGEKIKVIAGVIFQPIVTIFIGSLFFIPYNLFAKSGPPYDMLPWAANLEAASFIHMITFAAAGFLFWMKWRKPQGPRDELLMVFPFMYLVAHAYMFIAKFDHYFAITAEGFASDGLAVGNLFAVIFALGLGTAIVMLSHPPSDKE